MTSGPIQNATKQKDMDCNSSNFPKAKSDPYLVFLYCI